MCPRRGARACIAALVLLASSLPASAMAEEQPPQVFGYSPSAQPLNPDDPWVDPALLVGLDPDELTPPPDFEVSELHDSTVFASGVDWIVVEDDILDDLADRHVRVLQVAETLDQKVNVVASTIRQRRPRVSVLNEDIAHEHAEEARLAEEILTLNTAIAEFAVRAFIYEDELETALTMPDTELSETRVVSDEVRADQFKQIATREAEVAEREIRRAALEEELRSLRSELRTLRRQRLDLLTGLRSMNDLADRSAATYQVAMHARLERFVDGTDVPLVALNAYVIASRVLEEESPSCGIEWWMLAGIGKIESIHGHFGDSTLDIDGNTTDAITGPALDGRILEGSEFLVEGVELPEATDRTEAIEIDPAALPEGSVQAQTPGPGSTGAEPAPVPVIKRLALIKDTDGGRLDGDTTYDRAVGPMQFIPQTWRTYEADANQDDEMDPQNVYDAAQASARYLCTAAGSMTTEEGQQRAYFAYNHDQEYSDAVAAAAEFYRTRITLPAEPEGTAHELGVSNPALIEVGSRAAIASKELDQTTLPDW